jgi:hypothetical protein
MTQHLLQLNMKILVAVATAFVLTAGCTTSKVSGCKDDDPGCRSASLTVRVFDNSSDAHHGRPSLHPVAFSLNRMVAGNEEPVATIDESQWSLPDLAPGTYVLRIVVGQGTEQRKTLTERFKLDAGRGKVVKVVLANQSEALKWTLIAAGVCVVAVLAATVEPMGHGSFFGPDP